MIDGERRQIDPHVIEWPESSGWQCGSIGRYRLSPHVDDEALADFLESDESRELAKRIIDGTRFETVDGSAIGFADGSARAAETELVWLLRQPPDHRVSFCTAQRWLLGQGDSLEHWHDGTFDEAVKRLVPAFNQALAVKGRPMLGRWARFTNWRISETP